MVRSAISDTQREYGSQDLVTSIGEEDIKLMCTIKLPSPKEWVVLRVVYFLVMTYFEQVIGGAFSQDTTDKLANDNVTTKASKQNNNMGKKMMTSQSIVGSHWTYIRFILLRMVLWGICIDMMSLENFGIRCKLFGKGMVSVL